VTAKILEQEWRSAHKRHGWIIGRYVIMPDHAHFFCTPEHDAKTLSQFVGAWKRWISRRIHELIVPAAAQRGPRTTSSATPSVWQCEFFDHVLRSAEGYEEKWNYVRENPLRTGLVFSADDWPYAGEIERLEF
jgi:REP element-mobilizing transposase RayT